MVYSIVMDVRAGIERKLDAKRKELADLELKVREQHSYIRALEDTLRLMDGEDEDSESRGIRVSSDVGRSQEALRAAGKPLHVSDLLRAMGKQDDKRNRVSLAGTLAGYVRRNHVFTRPGPNIFGLIEFSERTTELARSTHGNGDSEPPAFLDRFASLAANYVFIESKNSPLFLVLRSLSSRKSIASMVPIGLRMRRSTYIFLS